jgi:hypothetical protein
MADKVNAMSGMSHLRSREAGTEAVADKGYLLIAVLLLGSD